jgi:hypothetical protein
MQNSRNNLHEEEIPSQSEQILASSLSNDMKSKDILSPSSSSLSHTRPAPFHHDVESITLSSSDSGINSKNTSNTLQSESTQHNKMNNSISLLKSSVHSTKKRSLSIPRINITKTHVFLTATKSAPVSSKTISSEY